MKFSLAISLFACALVSALIIIWSMIKEICPYTFSPTDFITSPDHLSLQSTLSLLLNILLSVCLFNFPSTVCWKRLYVLAFLSKISWAKTHVSGLLILFYHLNGFLRLHYFDLCSFVVIFKVGKGEFSQFFSSNIILLFGLNKIWSQ